MLGVYPCHIDLGPTRDLLVDIVNDVTHQLVVEVHEAFAVEDTPSSFEGLLS